MIGGPVSVGRNVHVWDVLMKLLRPEHFMFVYVLV